MRRPPRRWLAAALFALGLLLLISLAVGARDETFFFVMMAIVLAAVTFFYLLFPGSYLFSIALADFLAVYSCLFVFFVETNFEPVSIPALQFGFAFPILTFLAGVWWRRESIRRIVMSDRPREQRRFGHVFVWLIPVFAIGALTFVVPGHGLGPVAYDMAFLATMGVIAVIVLFVSRSLCTFLLDTGLLFEEFFEQISGLIIPAVAFFIFYSLIVIVFACIYRIVDLYAPGIHFNFDGAWQKISFTDSLYFSIITLSTVGYGDIEPVSNLARAIVAVQIVFGVLLLLFGFSEIIRYAHEHQRSNAGDQKGDD